MLTFVSHSFKDEAVYSALCMALDASGVVRWDPQSISPGESLSGQLQQAIQKCKVCVFVATRRSIESPWCLAELGAFWGVGKRVLMYMADPDLAESTLPPQFKGILRVDSASVLIEALNKANNEQDDLSPGAEFFTSSSEYGSEKDWESLLLETNKHFDLMGLTLDSWRTRNRFRENVLAKAEAGCKVRFLLMQEGNQALKALIPGNNVDFARKDIQKSFAELSSIQEAHDNISVRQIRSGVAHFSLTRSDNYLVVTPYLSHKDWGYGPTWRCTPGSALFESVIGAFEHLWTDNEPKAKPDKT